MDTRALRRYIVAVYWAFTTLSTVGYGDVLPGSIPEKIFAMFIMLLGCALNHLP